MSILPIPKKTISIIVLVTFVGVILLGYIALAIWTKKAWEGLASGPHENTMNSPELKAYVEGRLDLTFPESIQWEKDIYYDGFQDDSFHAKFQIPAQDLEKLFPASEFPWSTDEKKPSFLISKTDKVYDWFDYETLENSMHFDVDRGAHRFCAIAESPPVDTTTLITVYFEWLSW